MESKDKLDGIENYLSDRMQNLLSISFPDSDDLAKVEEFERNGIIIMEIISTV